MGLETDSDTGRWRWHLEANPRGFNKCRKRKGIGRRRREVGNEGERKEEKGREGGREQEHEHKTRSTTQRVALWVGYSAGKK